MNVVYIGLYNKGEILSGPEKVSKRIFNEYSKIDNTLLIHYFQEGEKYSYKEKLFGLFQTDNINGSKVLRLGIIRMLFILLKIRPKCIHILCYSRFVVFLYLLKLFYPVKIHYTVNGVIIHENKYYRKERLFDILKNRIVENITMNCSDTVFYLSNFTKNIILKYYNVNKIHFVKVINGLDYCFIIAANYRKRDIDNNSIVFIGDILRKEKGFSFLIESLKLTNNLFKLYVVGENKGVLFYKQLKNVEVFYVDKMPPVKMIEFLSDKNIIVSTSEYDPFNISALEAISCGLLPVLTFQTGLSEYIIDYTSISIIEYGDIKSLSDNIEKICNKELTNGLIKDIKEFSWDNVLKKYYLPYYE